LAITTPDCTATCTLAIPVRLVYQPYIKFRLTAAARKRYVFAVSMLELARTLDPKQR
jgi:hypothetical protein